MLMLITAMRLRGVNISLVQPDFIVPGTMGEHVDMYRARKELQALFGQLDGVVVTARVMEQTPSIAEAFAAAAKRCHESRDEAVVELLSRWTGTGEGRAANMSLGATPSVAAPSLRDVGTPSSSSPASNPSTGKAALRQPRPQREGRNLKLGSLFAAMREKGAEEDSAALAALPGLVAKLQRLRDGKALLALVPRLQSLWASSRVLQQEPSVLENLTAAAKRCRKSNDPEIAELLRRWRDKLEGALEMAHPAGGRMEGKADAANCGAPSVTRVTPTPCRPKERPNMNLGAMFSKLRDKQDEEEVAIVESAQGLLDTLEAVDEASKLRNVMPKLQALAVSTGVLRRLPALLPTFEKAAKRCRKSKEEAVAELLGLWRELLKAGAVRDADERGFAAETPAPKRLRGSAAVTSTKLATAA